MVVSVGDQSKKTEVVEKNLNPEWNKSFAFTMPLEPKVHFQHPPCGHAHRLRCRLSSLPCSTTTLWARTTPSAPLRSAGSHSERSNSRHSNDAQLKLDGFIDNKTVFEDWVTLIGVKKGQV